MMSPADEDVRPSDVALAIIVAMLTLTAMYIVVEIARLQQRITPPVVDTRIPIRVKPVLDLPVPAPLAGAPPPAAEPPPPEPPSPAEPPPPEPPPPEVTTPSDKPPPPRKPRPEVAKANTETPPATPPPPETPPAQPGPPAEPTPPVSDGEAEPSRGRDPLGDKAIAAYRERLIRWLSARFEVRGSGLTRAQLETMRAKAQIDIREDGRVTGYTIVSADHPAFDTAARAALDAVKGEPVPPPPEFYPGALQRRIKVTFVCTESTCD